MSKGELDELLNLTGWTKRKLAQKLKMSENVVYRWFSDREPSEAIGMLLTLWLKMARKRAARAAS